MVFLFKILVYTFMIPWYIIIYLMYFMIKVILYTVYFIGWIFDVIARLFVSRKRRVTTNYYTSYEKTKHKNNKIIDLKEEDYDEEFEREAQLWSLSEEDKRIAKEERMSPADFIEAEERDDDELVTDEWEDEI